MHTIRVLLPALLFGAAASGAAQQDPIGRTTPSNRAPVAQTTTITAPLKIDGRLDEEVWQGGRIIEGFLQREPRQGDAVSERTVVRILTDKDALYVGAWLYDRTPGSIVPGEKIR